MASPRIALGGTFDVANFGDLLFPLVAERELRARLDDPEIVPYSYYEKSKRSWPYDVRSLVDLGGDIGSFDLVIVGGGHLIRFDKRVAPGYTPPAGIHHPTGYWLMPTLLAAAAGVPVAWNAVSASSDTPAWAQELISVALASASYVAVRDEPSVAELTRFAGQTTVHLVPDTALGIRKLLPEEPSESFCRLCADVGLVAPYVIVQPTEHLVPFASQVDRALTEAAASGCVVLELPISPCLGDKTGLLGLATPTVRVSGWPRPLLLAELIARSEAVITRSLHLSIVALANGVPVHRHRSAPDPKYQALEPFQTVHWWTDDDDGAQRVRAGLGRGAPEPAVADHLERLRDHWDAIAALVGERNRGGQNAIAGLLGKVTEALEAAASPPDSDVPDDRGPRRLRERLGLRRRAALDLVEAARSQPVTE
jgi:hypothetical protein